MIDFAISFFSLIFDFISCFVGLFAISGGCLFFVLTFYDIFCPIGKEYLYLSDEFQKGKKSLRWNRKK